MIHRKSKQTLVLSLLFVALSFFSHAQSTQLTEMQFHKGEVGGIWDVWRSKFPLEWNKVQLPHTFNAEDTVDPDVRYYQGEGWYKTNLKIENPNTNGRTILHFEGSGHKTSVYVYDELVDKHVGGYNEFWIDITDAVQAFKKRSNFESLFKGGIPLAILSDNTRDLEMLPSDMSDFNLYGGLYRKLHLKYLPEIAIKKPRITPVVSDNFKKALVNIELPLYNPKKISVNGKASYKIINPQGKTINQGDFEMVSNHIKALDVSVKKAVLWSPSEPNLYKIEINWTTSKGNQTITEKFGLRKFEFIKKGPFHLNGKRLLIRGTHRHEDQAGLGAAEPDSIVLKEFTLMKNMGVNFVRLGHYQQSEYVLDLCDELGIMVWEEIPWCRGGLGGGKYQQQGKDMLTDLINQHYNHPAVIIWGMGNENDWPGDFKTFSKDSIRAYMTELNDLSHKLDPTRKTGIRRCDYCSDIIDVYSPSIWAGWYSGKFTEYKKSSRKAFEKVDHFFHMEWGGSSHMYRHSENPDKGIENIKATGDTAEKDGDFLMKGGKVRASKDSDWTTSYIVNVFDWTLKEQETMPWLTGAAAWIFKDYSTAVRPRNPIPYVNQKGVLERDLKIKESYYVFQSYWTEKPMVHIYGSTWDTRWGNAEDEKLLKVYSNCETVELFLNGKSLGKRKRDSQNFPAAGLRWLSPLKSGKNTLKAIGYKGKVKVEETISIKYQTEKWGTPSQLKLTQLSNKNGIATIEARMYDENGVQCLDAKNFVRFGITGEGELIKNQGTSDGSDYIQLYNGRAIIKVKTAGGSSIASVKAEDIPVAFCKLN